MVMWRMIISSIIPAVMVISPVLTTCPFHRIKMAKALFSSTGHFHFCRCLMTSFDVPPIEVSVISFMYSFILNNVLLSLVCPVLVFSSSSTSCSQIFSEFYKTNNLFIFPIPTCSAPVEVVLILHVHNLKTWYWILFCLFRDVFVAEPYIIHP